MTLAALNTFSSEELIKAVSLLDKPTALESALASKLLEAEKEVIRVGEVFDSLAKIVDKEL